MTVVRQRNGPSSPAAVLFDLDGTVIDSAPDLAGAANQMRISRSLNPVPYETLRPYVGSGARGMVGAAFGVAPDTLGFDAMRDEFLSLYTSRLLSLTKVFDDMVPVLRVLEAHGIPWGIVTNKHQRFTTPIMAGLGLDSRAAVVICGDTTPYAKPHPAPLLEAAHRLGFAPERCVYVGDDRRDMLAARAAAMRGAAAGWGYIEASEDVTTWEADAVLEAPHDVLKWLSLA